jgi:hypothetical protein
MCFHVSAVFILNRMEPPMSRIRESSSPSQAKKMHVVAEARLIMREAVPPLPFEGKMAWLKRVAGVLGLTFSQAKKIEYLELKDMRASRLDAMRDQLAEVRTSAAKRQGASDAIKDRLADLRSALGSREAGGDRGGARPAGGGSVGAGKGGSR